MTTTDAFLHESTSVDVAGTSMVVERRGAGTPVIVVHGEDGTLFLDPFVDALAASHTVHLLHLPGWGVTADSRAIEDIDDLALLLADYIEAQGTPMPVVGLSLGAWVVAHAAAIHRRWVSHAVLVAPVGIKTLARDQRSYVDLWATDPDVLRRLLYGDESRMPDLTRLDDDGFLRLAHGHEAVARHVWEPYLHDPKLPRRLTRIEASTLVVTGSEDRFVLEPDFGARWTERIGANAHGAVLAGVGHRIEEEAPAELAALVADFLRPTSS